jgi:hypothetical protein
VERHGRLQPDAPALADSPTASPEPQRFSRIYRGRRELIDHIFSSHLVTHAVGDGDITTGPIGPSVDDDPNDRRNQPGSDRRPLVANIVLASRNPSQERNRDCACRPSRARPAA